MLKRRRIQTVAESADGADDEGNFFRYFEYDGQITLSEVTALLGCPGLTLAREDFAHDEDHVFGLATQDNLFADPQDAGAPTLWLYSAE